MATTPKRMKTIAKSPTTTNSQPSGLYRHGTRPARTSWAATGPPRSRPSRAGSERWAAAREARRTSPRLRCTGRWKRRRGSRFGTWPRVSLTKKRSRRCSGGWTVPLCSSRGARWGWTRVVPRSGAGGSSTPFTNTSGRRESVNFSTSSWSFPTHSPRWTTCAGAFAAPRCTTGSRHRCAARCSGVCSSPARRRRT